MSDGIRVAALEDIPEGEGIVVVRAVAGTDDDIALLRDDDGTVWALNNTCTHAEASLAEGWVEGGHVECPSPGGHGLISAGLGGEGVAQISPGEQVNPGERSRVP